MAWKRELILERLAAVLAAVDGSLEFVRNRAMPTDKRPAIQLLDSDETAQREAFNRGRPSTTPNFVVMSPGIYVVIKNKKPVNEAAGPELNAFAAKVIKAVMTDAALKELVGSNGEIRYEGLATDLGEDQTQEGKARVLVSFVYVFRPSDL